MASNIGISFDDIHFRKSNSFVKDMTDKAIAKETLGVDLEGYAGKLGFDWQRFAVVSPVLVHSH